LTLQSRHSTAWAMPPIHFALLILGRGLINYLALNYNSPDLNLSSSKDYRLPNSSISFYYTPVWQPTFFQTKHLWTWKSEVLPLGLPKEEDGEAQSKHPAPILIAKVLL
jgi:hypothetical protein